MTLELIFFFALCNALFMSIKKSVPLLASAYICAQTFTFIGKQYWEIQVPNAPKFYDVIAIVFNVILFSFITYLI